MRDSPQEGACSQPSLKRVTLPRAARLPCAIRSLGSYLHLGDVLTKRPRVHTHLRPPLLPTPPSPPGAQTSEASAQDVVKEDAGTSDQQK